MPKNELAGIYIGKKRLPFRLALKQFREREIPVARSTLSRVRNGNRSGLRVDDRGLCDDLLQRDQTGDWEAQSAFAKDRYYLKIARLSTVSRGDEKDETSNNASKDKPEVGLLKAIAWDLDIAPNTLQSLMRAFRAELVFSEQTERKMTGALPKTTEIFCSVIDVGLEEVITRKNISSKLLQKLREDWDNLTTKDFYKHFYKLPVGTTRGVLVYYELKIMQAFYEQRAGHKLTPFDQAVLTKFKGGVAASDIAQDISSQVEIPVAELDVLYHKNLLVHGDPEHHLFEGSKQKARVV